LNLGISVYFGYRLPLAERIRLIKEAGFTHTTLWWGPPEEMYESGKQHAMPELVRSAGLILENLHAPFEECNQLWSANPSERAAFVERHLSAVKDCARHNVKDLVFHVSQGSGGPGPNEEGLDDFRRIVAAGEDARVGIVVENTRRDDICDFLFSRVDSPALGFCYDSSHDWLWGNPRTHLLRAWGQRLRQTHLSDPDDNGDRHVLPGDGLIDWNLIAPAFPRDTYRGILMLEVMPRDVRAYDSPAAFLAEARKRLLQLGGRLA
jgi:sugar phosphate isomerase/epimerase